MGPLIEGPALNLSKLECCDDLSGFRGGVLNCAPLTLRDATLGTAYLWWALLFLQGAINYVIVHPQGSAPAVNNDNDYPACKKD